MVVSVGWWTKPLLGENGCLTISMHIKLVVSGFQVETSIFRVLLFIFLDLFVRSLEKRHPKIWLSPLKWWGFGLMVIDESYGPMGRSRKKMTQKTNPRRRCLASNKSSESFSLFYANKGWKISKFCSSSIQERYTGVSKPEKTDRNMITRNEQQKNPQRDESNFWVEFLTHLPSWSLTARTWKATSPIGK